MFCPGDKFKCRLESFNSIDRDESFLTILLQDTEMLETLAERVEETGLGYLRDPSGRQHCSKMGWGTKGHHNWSFSRETSNS